MAEHSAQQTNRVRVEDALSYLDLVKTQFSDQPLVYTDFLDIMKDFKSQAIDTVAVITRVGQLFRGRPQLIVGFNTFLPSGYEITVDQVGAITIREPGGNIFCVEDPINLMYEFGESGGDEQDFEFGGIAEGQGEGEEEYDEEEGDYTQEGELDDREMDIVERDETDYYGAPEQHRELTLQRAREQGNDELENGDDEDVTEDHQRRLMELEETSPIRKQLRRLKEKFVDFPELYQQFIEVLQVYYGAFVEGAPYAVQYAAESTMRECVKIIFKDTPELLSDLSDFIPHLRGFSMEDSDEDEESADPLESYMRDAEYDVEESEADSTEGSVIEGPHTHLQTIRRALDTMDGSEFSFFDEMRSSLPKHHFESVIRHLDLYAANICTRKDVIHSLVPILSTSPSILNRLNEMMRYCGSEPPTRVENDMMHQIDYSSCKLLGVSYRSLPENFPRPKCSGRTELCREVLNDTWVSFPSWASEDSSSVSSKKTQYEEFISRTEEERYEMEIVIEMNKYAIDCLKTLQRRLNAMSTAETDKLKLDEQYGVRAPAILQRAIRRLYGEGAVKMLDGLRNRPAATVSVKVKLVLIYDNLEILERLEDKGREWKDAQTHFNKTWKEQTEKHMVRSLDHHSTSVKNNDAKYLRTKNLITQIEGLQEERATRLCPETGPHMILKYPEDRRSILDATDLLIHYVRRSNMSKEEKKKVKKVLRRFIPELFALTSEDTSDQEDNGGDLFMKKNEDGEGSETSVKRNRTSKIGLGRGIVDEEEDDKQRLSSGGGSFTYRLVYGGNTFYTFMRIHHLLCERLGKLRKACEEQLAEQRLDEKMRADSASWADRQRGIAKLRTTAPPHANFERVMHITTQSIDGILEPVALEDEMRAMLPTSGYLAFTLDKMVIAATRLLQSFSTMDADKARTLALYTQFRMERPPYIYSHTQTRSRVEAEYEAEALNTMAGYNCYRILILDQEQPILTIELLDNDEEDEDEEDERRDDEGSEPSAKRNSKKMPRPVERNKRRRMKAAEKERKFRKVEIVRRETRSVSTEDSKEDEASSNQEKQMSKADEDEDPQMIQ